ncbi:hypothetical protein HY498_05350 [Candidatus Woesearchaeota archaeon]|nr:hypothetical protein [Candidatus Woesearchaeota archaeon]
MVPKSLRTWFVIHFIVDMLFAIPLMFFTNSFLSLFKITLDLLSARLVAAAFLAIGGVSFLTRNASLESYQSLLSLKIIWSLSAILGIIITLYTSPSILAWVALIIFVPFSLIWIYYKRKLNF